MERSTQPTLTFLGGAGTVTGSKTLIATPQGRVLVDCGLFQGKKQLRLQNWDDFPVDPASIDAVLLTHAHIDHCGYLPRLVQHGFLGPVYCTPGTAKLAGIVLPDSGHLHEEEAAYANRKGYSKHDPALPLYTETDARACLERIEPVDFNRSQRVIGDVSATWRRAGHILGAASIDVHLTETDRHVVFSGDLGRRSHPLLVAPVAPGRADVLVAESTYGDRVHDDIDPADLIAATVNEAARRGGVLVIPAFAVDRTEIVLWHLDRLVSTGRVPSLPTFVDSPMALRALDVYRDEALRNGVREVKLLGKHRVVRAKVVTVELSAHADQPELIAWVRSAAPPPAVVYANHGEPHATAAFVERLHLDADLAAAAAHPGERVVI
jgi:metallo-beta-lactamase family protein